MATADQELALRLKKARKDGPSEGVPTSRYARTVVSSAGIQGLTIVIAVPTDGRVLMHPQPSWSPFPNGQAR